MQIDHVPDEPLPNTIAVFLSGEQLADLFYAMVAHDFPQERLGKPPCKEVADAAYEVAAAFVRLLGLRPEANKRLVAALTGDLLRRL